MTKSVQAVDEKQNIYISLPWKYSHKFTCPWAGEPLK